MNNVTILDTEDGFFNYEGTVSVVSVDGKIYVMWDNVVNYRMEFPTVDSAWEQVFDEIA